MALITTVLAKKMLRREGAAVLEVGVLPKSMDSGSAST